MKKRGMVLWMMALLLAGPLLSQSSQFEGYTEMKDLSSRASISLGELEAPELSHKLLYDILDQPVAKTMESEILPGGIIRVRFQWALEVLLRDTIEIAENTSLSREERLRQIDALLELYVNPTSFDCVITLSE